MELTIYLPVTFKLAFNDIRASLQQLIGEKGEVVNQTAYSDGYQFEVDLFSDPLECIKKIESWLKQQEAPEETLLGLNGQYLKLYHE